MASNHACCYLFLVYSQMGASRLHHDSKTRNNSPKGNILELGFPSAFNKCLINCGKIVPCLMQ